MTERGIDVSIVVPFYDEEDSLPLFLPDLLDAARKIKGKNVELVLVDDGSTDRSAEIAADFLDSSHFAGSLISFARNFGQTAALEAGLHSSAGDIVVTLDADGQNRPEDIPLLLETLEAGFDCVSGWRRSRDDPEGTRKLLSRVANGWLRRATGVDVKDTGCTLKAYRGDVIRALPLYGDMHRFIPYLLAIRGARVTDLEVNHRARLAGKSKYTLGRAWRVLIDIAMLAYTVRFQTAPLRFLGSLGLITTSSGITLFVSAALLKALLGVPFVETPLVLVGTFLTLAGLQLFTAGLVAESFLRISFDARGYGASPQQTVTKTFN